MNDREEPMGSTDDPSVLARQSAREHPARPVLGADGRYVGVRGIWLRKIGDQVQVLAEGDDGWHLVIEERADGNYSHIVEPPGIIAAPLDPLLQGDALDPEDQGCV
jgi:hypothetical protein